MEEQIARQQMVAKQLLPRGIHDLRILSAMREVPRHLFVPEPLEKEAYGDTPLPIEEQQTISQPYIVALMTQAAALKPTDNVLEIGTGSGYGAAVASRLVQSVHTVERHPILAASADQRCQRLGYSNIAVHLSDGTKGWPEEAPYDAILVTARANKIPQPLLDQLAVGGRLVMPLGDEALQQLILVTKEKSGQFQTQILETVRFVALIGEFA
jgi:protein-L-isoaspartate(D-aspartate) O-methyltransferase